MGAPALRVGSSSCACVLAAAAVASSMKTVTVTTVGSRSRRSTSSRNTNRNRKRPLQLQLGLISSPFAFNIKSGFTTAMASQSQMAPSQETIHAHQEAAARLPPVVEARTLLYQSTRAVLSTLSFEHQGYPSASMVDFACHHDGSPILALSSLALHSKNLSANPKCCLLVAKDPDDRTDTLITLYGDAIPVSGEETEQVRAAYLKRHPDAFWVDFGDFHFIQIKPTFIRYVSGVATARLGSGEFTAEEYKSAKVDPISQFARPIMSHMNKDHSEDTKLIVQHSTSVEVDSAYMLDVDSLGFNVKAEYEGRMVKLRIPFPRPAQERKDVKNLIVEMLQAAKGDTE